MNINRDYQFTEDGIKIDKELYEEFMHTKEYRDYVKRMDRLEEQRKEYQSQLDAVVKRGKDRKNIGKWLQEHPKSVIALGALGVGGLFALSGGIGVLPVGALLGSSVGLGAWATSTIYFKKIFPNLDEDKRKAEASKYKKYINEIDEQIAEAKRMRLEDYCEFVGIDIEEIKDEKRYVAFVEYCQSKNIDPFSEVKNAQDRESLKKNIVKFMRDCKSKNIEPFKYLDKIFDQIANNKLSVGGKTKEEFIDYLENFKRIGIDFPSIIEKQNFENSKAGKDINSLKDEMSKYFDYYKSKGVDIFDILNGKNQKASEEPVDDDYIKVDNEEPYEANNQKNKQEDNAVQMTDEEVMKMLQNTSYNQNVTQEPEWASDQDVINSNPYDRPQDGGRGRR